MSQREVAEASSGQQVPQEPQRGPPGGESEDTKTERLTLEQREGIFHIPSSELSCDLSPMSGENQTTYSAARIQSGR